MTKFFSYVQQAPIELERIKSINSESTFKKPHLDNKVKKLPAKISPWALARLNPEDAFRAVAEARKNSFVLLLRQIAVMIIQAMKLREDLLVSELHHVLCLHPRPKMGFHGQSNVRLR